MSEFWRAHGGVGSVPPVSGLSLLPRGGADDDQRDASATIARGREGTRGGGGGIRGGGAGAEGSAATDYSCSVALTSASQREFIDYLLDGSGVEKVVDVAKLRRELEEGHLSGESRSPSPGPATSPKFTATSTPNLDHLKHTHSKTGMSSLLDMDVDLDVVDDIRQELGVPSRRQLSDSNYLRQSSMPRPHPSWGPEKDQEAERVVEETMRPLESSTRIPTLPKPANLNLGSSFKDSRVTNWLKSSTSTQNLIGPLDEISERLVTHGYAPLHHTLLTNPANNSQPGLTERQSRSLRQAFLQIFDDHDKKSRIIRDLSLKLEEEREETEKLRRQFSMLENNMKSDSEADLRIIQEQQELISSLKAEIASFDSSQRTLQRELEECKEETTALRRKLQQSEVKNQSVQAEIDDLKEKIEKRQILSEQSFADITNRHMKDPTKSGVDRLTLQVIDAYEKRLESLRSELKAERLRGSTRNGETDLNDEVLLKELIETRRNFENAVEDAAEARKELELARLKLLETKKPDWIAKTKQAVGEGLSTRELIRRDKQAWRMKLFYIDGMDIDECRQLLKEVCCKLAIPDVSQLIPGLSAIDATLRLLPQVQSFVLAINSLVHTHYLRFVTDEVTPADEAMKKLDELVDIVAMWGRSVEGIDRLRRFKQEMLRAVSVQDGPDAMDHCLDAIFKLRESYKELVNDAARKEQNTEGQAGRIVRHFMDLFDIPTMNDVLPMMNEIYVKWAERNAGIARLRSSLLRNNSRALGGARLDSDSPGRVMLKAAEIIETLAGEETTRGSTPYLQSLNK